jgi:hypothetical protein
VNLPPVDIARFNETDQQPACQQSKPPRTYRSIR